MAVKTLIKLGLTLVLVLPGVRAVAQDISEDLLLAPPEEARFNLEEPSWWRKNWPWVAGGTLLVAGLSQVRDAPIAFAALEAGGAFYLMNEWHLNAAAASERRRPKDPLTKLITPLTLTTLALVNLTLLREDDATRGDVFRYNAAGLTLATLSYHWTY